jgi:hypothetical protein
VFSTGHQQRNRSVDRAVDAPAAVRRFAAWRVYSARDLGEYIARYIALCIAPSRGPLYIAAAHK